MSDSGCGCRRDCLLIAIAASVVVGIIAAVLSFAAIITITPVILWVALGLAVLFLLVVLTAALFVRNNSIRRCLCGVLPPLLTGILGAILTAVVLLTVAFGTAIVLSAIVTGALAGFLTLIVTALVCLIRCASECCDTDDERDYR